MSEDDKFLGLIVDYSACCHARQHALYLDKIGLRGVDWAVGMKFMPVLAICSCGSREVRVSAGDDRSPPPRMYLGRDLFQRRAAIAVQENQIDLIRIGLVPAVSSKHGWDYASAFFGSDGMRREQADQIIPRQCAPIHPCGLGVDPERARENSADEGCVADRGSAHRTVARAVGRGGAHFQQVGVRSI